MNHVDFLPFCFDFASFHGCKIVEEERQRLLKRDESR